VVNSEVVLASASPRRLALLRGAGLAVTLRPVDIDEVENANEAPDAFAERMAVTKAQRCQESCPGRVILAGDTVVTYSGKILGKPVSAEEAATMLRGLSNRTHQVVTGWAILGQDGDLQSGTVTADVDFEDLTEETIASYVLTGEPMDKAGAYGIQGQGGTLVRSYRGDFSTIVGFPLPTILSALSRIGVIESGLTAHRLRCIQGRIAAAAAECGRSPAEITIVGAGKSQSSDCLQRLYDLGMRHFGESYVQEFRQKVSCLPDDITWHFIGRLQRNKVKHLIPGTTYVQTVDSLRLAETIASNAQKTGNKISCLVQVNLGNEESKAGVSEAETELLIDQLSQFGSLSVVGLMAIPPRGGLSESRHWFRRLRRLRDNLATPERPLSELSMGMSADFDGAVLEGATMIRLGTILFGERGSKLK